MSVLRFALPALAIARLASAQCSASATKTIENAADATALAGCETFEGSIALATSVAGDISLAGIQSIEGNLVAADSLLISLSATDLETITGSFSLDNVTQLASLSFPSLTTVGKIVWNAVPALSQLTFTKGVTKADTVDIQNTGLTSLAGINLKTVDTFVCANNRNLNQIEAQLKNITGRLTIEGNGDSLTVSFPNLETADNMTIHDSTSVSLPSLESLTGSLGFYNNLFESFIAANLTSLGGALAFVSNEALNNISLPLLTKVDGAFQVHNNTDLKKIDDFPKLETVTGALDFFGNFTEVDLPSLKDVRGAFNLQSTESIDDTCAHFDSMHGATKVIKGKYFCAGKLDDPTDADSAPNSNSNGGKKNAAGRLDVSSLAAFAIAAVAAFGML